MPDARHREAARGVFLAQAATILFAWAFLGAAASWLVNLARVAHSLGDAVPLTTALCAAAVCVYALVVGILTWVFFALRRGRRRGELE